jgi:predicted NUDIX family NTP pyrophosphohydrolase
MKASAGILFFRTINKEIELLLVHPGGPFWKKKDNGAWTIPKGEIQEGEEPFTAALREVEEETGIQLKINSSESIELKPLKQKSGKLVYAWAIEMDLEPSAIESNEFEMEWPPRSGKKCTFPEIDKAAWFNVEVAKEKIITAQVTLIDELVSIITL